MMFQTDFKLAEHQLGQQLLTVDWFIALGKPYFKTQFGVALQRRELERGRVYKLQNDKVYLHRDVIYYNKWSSEDTVCLFQ